MARFIAGHVLAQAAMGLLAAAERFPRRLGMNPALLGKHPRRLGNDPFLLGKHPQRLGNDPFWLGINPAPLGKLTFLPGNDPQRLGKHPFFLGKHPQALGKHPFWLGKQPAGRKMPGLGLKMADLPYFGLLKTRCAMPNAECRILRAVGRRCITCAS